MAVLDAGRHVDATRVGGWVVSQNGGECTTDEEIELIQHAMNRLFLFLATALPALLGVAAWADKALLGLGKTL